MSATIIPQDIERWISPAIQMLWRNHEVVHSRILRELMQQKEAELLSCILEHLCSEHGRVPGEGPLTQVRDCGDNLVKVERGPGR